MTHQIPLPFPDGPVTGKVWRDGERWFATIQDWWMASGKTEQEAIRKVTENYERETNRLTSEGKDV